MIKIKRASTKVRPQATAALGRLETLHCLTVDQRGSAKRRAQSDVHARRKMHSEEREKSEQSRRYSFALLRSLSQLHTFDVLLL